MADANQAGQGMSDKEVLEFANAQKRILITLNRRHFIRLHQLFPKHYGIVVCSFEPNFAALARRIHEALIAEKPVKGKLIRINRPR